jgi:hypothetical protein
MVAHSSESSSSFREPYLCETGVAGRCPRRGSNRWDYKMPILRSAFIALSQNRPLRSFSERSSVGRRLSSRFVAGLEIDDALRVADAVNRQGMAVTLDSLGESVRSEVEAHKAAEI